MPGRGDGLRFHRQGRHARRTYAGDSEACQGSAWLRLDSTGVYAHRAGGDPRRITIVAGTSFIAAHPKVRHFHVRQKPLSPVGASASRPVLRRASPRSWTAPAYWISAPDLAES